MDESVKVKGMRRIVAQNMAASWVKSPGVLYQASMDTTAMTAFRKKLAETCGRKISVNVIFAKACAKALTEFPYVNASFCEKTIELHGDVNVGFAVSMPDGVIVPNVKNCDQKSFAEVAEELDALFAGAKAGTLQMEQITGGTFTITNMGVTPAVEAHHPIINQPELAILGVYMPHDQAVVVDGQIVIRPMMKLCLNADHRVIDGELSGRFLGRVKELLEHPEEI